MSLFPNRQENALYFSMDDPEELMSRNSDHSFKLDEQQWASVEHYYQAMKFVNPAYQSKIKNSNSAEQAKKLGQNWFKKKRSDYKEVRTTLMTRAVYTKAKTHPEIAKKLIKTGELELVENSQFDYFWGCGRDHRGDNFYGKILMNVRNKLLEEEQ